jgi:hypothetical protein
MPPETERDATTGTEAVLAVSGLKDEFETGAFFLFRERIKVARGEQRGSFGKQSDCGLGDSLCSQYRR